MVMSNHCLAHHPGIAWIYTNCASRLKTWGQTMWKNQFIGQLKFCRKIASMKTILTAIFKRQRRTVKIRNHSSLKSTKVDRKHLPQGEAPSHLHRVLTVISKATSQEDQWRVGSWRNQRMCMPTSNSKVNLIVQSLESRRNSEWTSQLSISMVISLILILITNNSRNVMCMEKRNT